jgi:2-hydroxycyclohexanecarboxyl-CoA dehydrogenase
MAEGAALITGGAGGIGRAICERLAADGHAIAVADLRAADTEAVARAIAASGRRAAGVACDVTDSASVAAAVEQATSELGPIEILVNNAGWDELHPFVDTDEDFWRRVVEINYMGCLRVTRAVLPGMVERGFGRIVSIASDAARAGSSGEAVYAGAKAGVVAFMKTIAREHARAGITANSVCPGPTRTPMLESMAARDEAGAKLIASLERAVPMRRLGEPADVAAAVAFFCSEEAAFITGQTLSVSGGLTMA